MSIGERLEEARKRKGVSIREAAEATKIRSDYLVSMENDSMDFDLPEIYKRGFLRNYARFVKLDPDKILTDYEARQISRKSRPGSTRESFGRMELPEDNAAEVATQGASDEEAGHGAAKPAGAGGFGVGERSMRAPAMTRQTDNTLYIKIAVVTASLVVLIGLLVVLIRMIAGGSDPAELNPELAETETPARQTAPAALGQSTLTLRATDSVTVIVEQTADRSRLFQGSLNAGDTQTFQTDGPVSIRFTNGAALVIERNGQELRLNQSGVGRTLIE